KAWPNSRGTSAPGARARASAGSDRGAAGFKAAKRFLRQQTGHGAGLFGLFGGSVALLHAPGDALRDRGEPEEAESEHETPIRGDRPTAEFRIQGEHLLLGRNAEGGAVH